jgi:NTP pyrophosphatase (non-canonical NTP hydrolase)
MQDTVTHISDLKAMVQGFCGARNWDQFHNPKDLAIGVITEASELLEHFRFQSREQCEAMLEDEQKKTAVGEELADVLFFLLRFSGMYGIDLSEAFLSKMAKNEARYPAGKFWGVNKKHNEV